MIKLSDSELYIMNVIWDKGKATSFDVLNKIMKDNKISENTVRTELARMIKKKAIEICEKNGKVYTYKSLIDRDEYLKYKTKQFIENVYQNDVKLLLDKLNEYNLIAEK